MNDNPDTLYHYTSIDGLEGIITEGKIRATNIFYLNDQSEFHHATDFLKQALTHFNKDYCTENPSHNQMMEKIFLNAIEDIYSKIHQNYTRHLQPPELQKNERTAPDIYTCSFTNDKGNSLSQWRGYCKNGGFSIGFKYDNLKRITSNAQDNNAPLKTQLKKCIYERKEKIGLISSLFIETLSRIKDKIGSCNTISENDVLQTSSGFIFEALKMIPLLKDDAFKDEQEWRIATSESKLSCIKFNINKEQALLKPYINIDLPKNDNDGIIIDKIYISPPEYVNENETPTVII